MDKILRTLREKGYKLTPQRRAVIQALLNCGKFPTAQVILDDVRKITPDVSFDTIYRNLSLLAKLGLLIEIHLPGREANVFELVSGHHHHHLVCLCCGNTQCMDYCPVNQADIQKAEATGFQVLSHSLEFYGYCPQCRSAG